MQIRRCNFIYVLTALNLALLCFWTKVKRISAMATGCWLSVDQVLTECWPSVDQLLTECWPIVDRVLTEYWLGVDRLLTECWLGVDRVLMLCCRPSVDRASIEFWSSFDRILTVFWRTNSTRDDHLCLFTVPTEIVTAPETVELVYGESVNFKCEATSDDSTPITIKWYDGQKVEVAQKVDHIWVNEDDNSLQIETSEDDDRGAKYADTYMCLATNTYSSANASAQLLLPPGPIREY